MIMFNANGPNSKTVDMSTSMNQINNKITLCFAIVSTRRSTPKL